MEARSRRRHGQDLANSPGFLQLSGEQRHLRHSRHRLSSNDNETVVDDAAADANDVEAHRLAGNYNETVVDGEAEDEAADADDVEGHRLAANDNETVVDGASAG